jgi:N-acetylmuramic acid 6-phosphate etherase
MTLPATELLDARSDALDTWPPGVLLQSLWEGQLAAVAAIGPALPALAAATIAATGRLRAHASGRLIYTGAGSSARLGAQDGAELAPTFDWPDARLLLLPAGGPAALTSAREGAEDDMTAAIEAVAAHRVGSADVMIAVAASGATPFTLAAASAARAAGALTIAIANSPGAPLLSACEHGVLIATGPEPVAGSTRMKAGTAQKVALNLLSTGVMIGLHRTHRGRMVEMRATNAKLAARAVRMVAELAGVDRAIAEAALAQTDGRCKPAVLVACGLDPRAAASALAATGGNLRAALALPPRRP